MVSFNYLASRNNLRRSANRLPAYGSVTLRLGQDFLNNPSGRGALTAPEGSSTHVAINCG